MSHARPNTSSTQIPSHIQFIDWMPYTHAQQTEIIGFGTSKEGHSCCVRFQNFSFTYSVSMPTIYQRAFDRYIQRKTLSSFRDNIVDRPKSRFLKNMLGFHPQAEPVLTYKFNSVQAWQWSARRLRQLEFPLEVDKHTTIHLPNNAKQLTLFDTSIDVVLQLLHTYHWIPMGWIDISSFQTATLLNVTGRISRCPYEWVVNCTSTSSIPAMLKDDPSIAPFVMASFDIECVSASHGFPAAEKEDDPIIQIATTVQCVGQRDPCLFHIITLGSVQPFRFAQYQLNDTYIWAPETVPPTHHPRTKQAISVNDWHISAYKDVVIEAYDTEREVLIAWTQLIQRIDPDIILGYNIFGFDISYMFTRPRILLEREYQNWCACCDQLKDLSHPSPNSWRQHVEDFRKRLAHTPQQHTYFDNLIKPLKWTTVEDIQTTKLDYYVPEQWDETQFAQMSRIRGHKATLCEKSMESHAYGHNDYRLADTYGRVWLDVFQMIKHEHNLPSYKLDYVGDHFVGQKKVDMSPYELFRLFQDGGEAGRTKIAIYCVQDTYLPLRIIDHLLWIHNNIAMANVCCVKMNTIILQGQQIKVFSQLANLAREKGYGIIESERNDDVFEEETKKEKYQGATVLTAQGGAYGFKAKPETNFPIAGLDFASLYPSVMIAYNLCYTTMIDDTKLTPKQKEYIKYEVVEWDDYHYAFVQSIRESDETNEIWTPYIGLLPQLLSHLLAERKKIKKRMAEETDPIRKSIYNGQQLAVKISANSVYGFTGTVQGILPCRPIAMSTTTLGRKMIDMSKNYAETHYNAEVIYGDSITSQTHVHLRRADGPIHTIPIKAMFQIARAYGIPHYRHDKESINTSSSNLQTWSDKGWTPIKSVIRHKIDPKKKRIFRIRTQSGSTIDVTEDHSLLDAKGRPVRPTDCRVGDTLLSCKLVMI